ncbi:DUF2510 domain-containing protein [Pseudolysinimonas sp.]|uniref:DUF2510 domain-containing protein n=1 Tax=Pseudolysinimonas sp. TaxID=2680009 RepID=UPI00286CB428|nr:DUF2510 domain-containing protein [Pseudolysinimonas sp.]
MSDVAPPQAGWYADPENPAGERWWNGSGWSDQKRASTVGGATVGGATFSGASVAATPVADSAGFSFGTPTADARPDPYAPPTYATQPAYAPASPYVAAPYGAPAYGSRSNGLAIAGLIVSAGGWIIFGVIASIAGIILSAFGLARAKRAEAAGNPNSGRGIAMAGLIIGIVVTVLGTLVFVIYLAFMLSAFPAGTTF